MRGKALKHLLRRIIKEQKTPKLGYCFFVAHPKSVQFLDNTRVPTTCAVKNPRISFDTLKT